MSERESVEPNNSPACVELSSKLKVPEGPVSTWSREQCVDWLKDIVYPTVEQKKI